jgi:hypothetical protein
MELRKTMELEGKNSSINKLNIQNQWLKITRLAKTENLKKNGEILSQNHEMGAFCAGCAASRSWGLPPLKSVGTVWWGPQEVGRPRRRK